MADQAKAVELEERLIDFAVRIIRLSQCLPDTPPGRHVAGQILRSGTSPAPNYGEARAAESRADFAHKIGIVAKEMNETVVWLRIIQRAAMVKPDLLADVLDEGQQLARIVTSSHHTLRKRKQMNNGK
jgi:four helix bundle protein